MLAYDEDTGEQAYKPVVQLFRNETNEWYHVFVNGEEIVCTGGHPFYVVGLDKFIPAKELKLYEKVLLSDGKCGTIDSIGIEALLKPETTYNFEVADYHTYYVGECNVLVHNTCVKDLKKDPSISRDIQGEGKYGSYEITYKSGNKYIGKGSQSRMWRSAANKANKYSDTVKSVRWRSAISDTDAFIQEAKWMRLAGWKGKGTPGFYNLINSPGFKHL